MARPEKPRILMFLMYPLWGSGSGVYARKLAETLAARGWEVAIACPDHRTVPGVKIFNLKLPFMAAFTSHPEYPKAKKYSELTARELSRLYRAFEQGFARAVDAFQPNVIHAHHAAHPAWIANIFRAIYRVNYMITVHGTEVYNASLDRRYIVPTQDALRHADITTVNSGYTRKWMLKIFRRVNEKNLRTIYGGVDVRSYPTTGGVDKVNARYGLAGKKVVLFTGKLIPTKGVTHLVQAAKYIDAEIVIAGDGPERRRLTRQAAGNPRVHFIGYLKDAEIAEFYRRADVMVVPSVWDEPFGLISLEAMSSGTPVVASRKGGINSVVKEGHNGYLVRAHSGRAIATGVNKILADPALRARMSRHARETVERRFSWQVIADQFAPHYKAIATATAARQQIKKPIHITSRDVERAKHEIDIAKKLQGRRR
jgi:glycosyltransferase involved in cell wall biosynthesis